MGDSTCRRFRNRDGSAIAGISPSFGRCSVQIIEEIGGNASPYAGNRPVFLKERDQLMAAQHHPSRIVLAQARVETIDANNRDGVVAEALQHGAARHEMRDRAGIIATEVDSPPIETRVPVIHFQKPFVDRLRQPGDVQRLAEVTPLKLSRLSSSNMTFFCPDGTKSSKDPAVCFTAPSFSGTTQKAQRRWQPRVRNPSA